MTKENFLSLIVNCSKEQLNDIIRKNGKERKSFDPIIYNYKKNNSNNKETNKEV